MSGNPETLTNAAGVVVFEGTTSESGGSQPSGALLPVAVASTGNIDLTAGGIPDPSLTDGYTVVAGDRVLVWAQTAPTESGVYVVNAGAWTRAPDMPTFSFSYPSTLDGVLVMAGSSGSLWSNTLFQLLAEAQTFQPIVSPTNFIAVNVDAATGLQGLSIVPGTNGTQAYIVPPTSDPGIAGVIWNDTGTLKVSLG